MFDLSQVAEGLKAAVPPSSFLSFKLDELNYIRSSIEYLRSSFLRSLHDEHEKYGNSECAEIEEEIEILTHILDKFDNYEFH